MSLKHLRLAAIMVQSLYCLLIFVGGIVTKVPFFYTFLGPAVLLAIIAFTPRFYYDVVAIVTIVMLVMMAFLFSLAVAVFNHEFMLAIAASAIPIICLATLIYCMEKLKKEDASYA